MEPRVRIQTIVPVVQKPSLESKEVTVKLRQSLVSIMKSILGNTNTYRTKYWLGYPLGAFHNDRVCLAMIDKLIKFFQITVFAESGTFSGATTRFMAFKYPKMTIHSSEVNERFYKDSLRRLQDYKNVHLHLGSSE